MNEITWDNLHIPVLLSYIHQTIPSERLDEILEIHTIKTFEALRYRRAQIIKEINQEYKLKTGTQLIFRINDPEDRRRFHYTIG